MKELLKKSNYRKLLYATLITKFGDALDSIALSWMVYILTGSKLLMGLIFAVSFIPNIIFLPISGVLADIMSKKKITFVGDFARGISVAILGILFATGVLEVWHLFAIVIVNSFFESFSDPARNSILPLVIEEKEYISGSSYLTSATNLGNLIGIGLAAPVIALLGVKGALFIDSMTFFISGFLILTLKIQKGLAKEDRSQVEIKKFLGMIGEGFSYVWHDKVLLPIILLCTFLNFSFVPFNVLNPVFAREVLKSGAEGMSLTSMGLLIGMIVGGLVVGKIGNKIPPMLGISLGLGLMGANYALLGSLGMIKTNNIPILLVSATTLSFFFGFFLPFAQAPMRGLLLKNTAKEKLGRISSIVSITTLSALPLGGALVGLVGEYISVEWLFVMMGIAGFLVSLLFGINNHFKKETITI